MAGETIDRRFALLLTSGTGSGSQQQLEVLPASATAVDAGLQEGAYYRSKVAPRAQLYWKQSPLNWHANPLASALCGSHVCGDAVLELEGAFECEWELSARLSAILARASPRSQLLQGLVAVQGQGWTNELPVPSALASDSSSTSSGGHFPGPRSPPGPRIVLTLPQLPNPSPTAMDTSTGAGTGSASALVPIPPPQPQQQQPQQQPAFLGVGSTSAVGAVGGTPGEEFEPRQQLMWAIASRATSISWAPSTPPARQGGIAAAATAAATAAASASSGVLAQGELAASAVGPGGAIEAGSGSNCQEMELEPCSAMAASSGSASGGADASCHSEEQAGSALGVAAGSVVDELQSPRWASRWADTRSEILATVVQQAGHSSTFAQLLGQVCAGWRQAVWEERGLLRLLRFQRCARASSGGGSRGPRADERLPCLILEAARAGNVSAAVAAARYVESLPPPAREQAGWFWGKAARRGHPEAQAKLGLAYYKGSQGLAVDCEEAVLWLSRSARQLMDCLSCLPAGGAAEPAAMDGRVGASASASGALCMPAPALLMTEGDCRRVLSQVAHILGLLHLDGEGTKMDLQAGIRWLKVADQHGCMEAGLVLGSLYNTGQFG